MKKYILSALSLVLALNLSAVTYTNQADIVLTSIATGEEEVVTVGEVPAFAAGELRNGYVSLDNSDGKLIDIYVPYKGNNYSSFNVNSLINMPLVIKTEAQSQYRFSFEYVEGSTLTIYDLENPGASPIAVSEGNSYVFTATASSVIADRFVINYHAADYTVTTNAYGWSTFAVNADVEWLASESPELKAYSGLVSADASALDLYEIAVADAVPAGEGVIFHGAANTTYNLYNAASATPIASNDLIGCTADKDVTAESNVFVLSGNAFQEYTGTYIPAGKAYIHVNTGSAAPAQRMAIRIHPVATGVEAVAGEAKAEKLVRDGQLLILRDGKTYNVQGQIVK